MARGGKSNAEKWLDDLHKCPHCDFEVDRKGKNIKEIQVVRDTHVRGAHKTPFKL